MLPAGHLPPLLISVQVRANHFLFTRSVCLC
uniref:Uncharacterized protein n=1 Tax=Arundo donax TaxID=35708 RepID=A0A0A9FQ64_ARUDO